MTNANTPTQAESLQHSLQQAAVSIDLHVYANKTEEISFNQKGDISISSYGSLKLVDKFTSLDSRVSSTENYINMRKHGLLAIGYRSYGSLTYSIK